ncbi:MAG TPA: hypothetical protein VIE15_06985, partial [Acidimicrobiales bacterium]
MTAVPGSSRRRRSMVVSLILMLVISFGSFFAVLAAGWSPRLGLDLAGGTELILTPATGHTISASQLNEAETIIRNRVAGIGVSGSTVQVQGNPPQIIVQVPGVDNGRQLQREIASTAQLLFRPVVCFAVPYVKPTGKTKIGNTAHLPACDPPYVLSKQNINVVPNSNDVNGYTSNNIPADPKYANYPSTIPTQDVALRPALLPGLPTAQGTARYVLFPAVMTGNVVSGAQAQQDSTGAWVVNCTLTSQGSVQWDHYSQQYFHQFMGIELDGIVQSAPLILPAQASWTSFNGQVSISGNLTQADANTL